MKALIQRVSKGSVAVDAQEIGRIGNGLVVLHGVKNGDTSEDARYLADKIVNLRIFEDEDGKFNLSALAVGAEILAISQFTLYAETRKGRRPSFVDAARPEFSEPLHQQFIEYLKESGLVVEQGQFGAKMLVDIRNDGPVTIMLET